jgi:hypothetical protein
MARLVYSGRQIWRWAKGKKHRQLRRNFRAKLLEVKSAIAANLSRAVVAGELLVRPEFPDVMQQVVFRDVEKVALVTTNWERTVAMEVAKIHPGISVRYLHGCCDDPENMYLPTEIVEEPYRRKLVRGFLSDRRAEVLNGIGEASKLVLYGLALSSLDAELGQVLASAMHASEVQQVHVIDPRYPLVAERIAGLTDAERATGVEVFGSLPTNLGRTWRFSPKTIRDECRALGLPC